MRTRYIELAREISGDVLRRHAADVDRANRFPDEAIAALRAAGLVGLMVPASRGGPGGSLRELAEVSALLGEQCLSTALIWSMHSQQAAIVGEYAQPQLDPLVRRIVDDGALVASVTTEPGIGADVWSSACPLLAEQGQLRVRRMAPVVSYGEQAGLYLIKMLAAEGRPPSDVVMVLVARDEAQVSVEGDWDALGMHGTRSVPMRIDALVDADRIVGEDYRAMAVATMVPLGYIGWSASWWGAARGRMQAYVQHLRRAGGKQPRPLNSDLLKHRLARLRLSLDLVGALLDRVVADCEALRGSGQAAGAAEHHAAHMIRLNNLKVASSEMAREVVDGLIELAGMRGGYLRGDSLALERVLRDLRSASLMYHNDQLLAANGNLVLVEGAPLLRPTAGQRAVGPDGVA